ncbi:MAG TPA: LLM class flavin-dependent oxidoreductase [Nitrososphaerales archaeon]|nr:LLM class flavin-dependent oxidoreductase [Nitrososphaerales archaeon]
MRLALGFNPVLSIEDAVKLASKAEGLGYESIWIHESLFQRDVVTYISAMAGRTSRIRLGSGVINTFTRHPVTAATTFATLSEASGGRVTLGLGLGSFPTIPLIGHQIFPVEKTQPLRRIREYVQVVKMVWGGEKVDFEGEFFKVHNLTLGFKVEGKVPIYIASLSPKTQAFAATVADGVILSPALNTPWGTEKMVENVKKGEERGGRAVERASYMLTSLDPDGARAAQAVRDYYFFVYQLSEVVRPEVLAPYGVTEERLKPMKDAWKKGDIPEAKRLVPAEAIEALTITGDGDHAHERVKEYARAGVTLPIAMPIGNVDYAMEELRR